MESIKNPSKDIIRELLCLSVAFYIYLNWQWYNPLLFDDAQDDVKVAVGGVG